MHVHVQPSPAAQLLQPSPADSKNFPFWPFQRYNHNVVLTFICAAFEGAGDSVWNSSVLPAFIYELMGQSNAYVGYVEAAQGIIILIVGLPMGWIADKFDKAPVIALGGLCVPVATAATAFAAVYGAAHQGSTDFSHFYAYWVLFGAMCVWGVSYAIYGGAQQAMLADSTPSQGRVWAYTKLSQISLLASALGPIISIVLFVVHGDKWAAGDMRNVLCAGLAIELPMFLPMMCYRKSATIDEDSSRAEGEEDGESGSGTRAVHGTNPLVTPADSAEAGDVTIDKPVPTEPETEPAEAMHDIRCVWLVPYIIFASELLFALGSGMTVKFFPLFFKNDLHLSPVGVQLIYLVLPLMMAALNGIGEIAARRAGRVPICVVFKLFGLSLLVTMALIKDWVAPALPPTNATDLTTHGHVHLQEEPTPAVRFFDDGDYATAHQDGIMGGIDMIRLAKSLLMVVIYLLRTTLMNSTYALEEGILMDFVPKESRARWKSLNAISTFGWTGSAFVGGLMVDATDYSTTFLITAALQFAGTLTFGLLLLVIPHRLDFEKDESDEQAPAGATDVIVEPLVAGSIQGGAPSFPTTPTFREADYHEAD